MRVAAEAPAAVPSVYLDTCCYQRPADLWAAANDPRVAAEANALLKVLIACEAGRAVRIVSSVNWYEAG